MPNLDHGTAGQPGAKSRPKDRLGFLIKVCCCFIEEK